MDEILSSPAAPDQQPRAGDRLDAGPSQDRPEHPNQAGKRDPKRRARRGRPPGKSELSRPAKEKVTVWIKKDLIDQYRDWSWEVRSQLSQLVERALTDYHDRQRSPRRCNS